MYRLERTITRLSQLLMAISGLLLLAMLIHMCADVVLKYALNSPIPGTAEVVAYYYMVAAVFLPLPLVEIRNGGIYVDLFYNLFGVSVRRVLILFAYLAQLGFFGLLAWQSSIDAFDALAKRELVEGQIYVYIWPARFFLPLGFGLAALVSALRIVQVVSRPDWERLTEYVADGGIPHIHDEG